MPCRNIFNLQITVHGLFQFALSGIDEQCFIPINHITRHILLEARNAFRPVFSSFLLLLLCSLSSNRMTAQIRWKFMMLKLISVYKFSVMGPHTIFFLFVGWQRPTEILLYLNRKKRSWQLKINWWQLQTHSPRIKRKLFHQVCHNSQWCKIGSVFYLSLSLDRKYVSTKPIWHYVSLHQLLPLHLDLSVVNSLWWFFFFYEHFKTDHQKEKKKNHAPNQNQNDKKERWLQE